MFGVELLDLVDDPIAPWNDARFAIEWRTGTARCERTDADPDVRLDMSTLSQLYVGSSESAPVLPFCNVERNGETVLRSSPVDETTSRVRTRPSTASHASDRRRGRRPPRRSSTAA
ncbi:sterol carrier protein domain-containing protein [Halorubrum sp. DTA98]|uniref:sterol carrier protein domain-containing protein n=1 Tax=Halorubrum sp. DTA98 TaxID=3402163 RepID=UPI003AB0C432